MFVSQTESKDLVTVDITLSLRHCDSNHFGVSSPEEHTVDQVTEYPDLEHDPSGWMQESKLSEVISSLHE